jgi:hypothetical protein
MTKKKEPQALSDGALVAAAKTLGAAAGMIAAAVGVTAPKKPKAPKLVVNRNESRLPRRQKKTAQKVATRAKRATKVKAAS